MPPEPPRPPTPEEGQEEAVVAPPSPERDGYQLLGGVPTEDGGLPVPDGLSSEDDASDDDDDQPQSVADLMASLERHGVNTVETGDDTADPADLDVPAAAGAPAAAAPRVKESDASLWPEGALEAERQRQKQAAQERLALYSTPTTTSVGDGGGGGSAAALAPDQAEAVRRAMRSVRLPAAEHWASELSEQQWRHQLDQLLGRPGPGEAAGTAQPAHGQKGQQDGPQDRPQEGTRDVPQDRPHDGVQDGPHDVPQDRPRDEQQS